MLEASASGVLVVDDGGDVVGTLSLERAAELLRDRRPAGDTG
jgi:hypothetical protein